MTPHIDFYKHQWPTGDFELKPEGRLDDETATAYADRREELGDPLPNFNGYSYLTEVHEDGECTEFAPGNVRFLGGIAVNPPEAA